MKWSPPRARMAGPWAAISRGRAPDRLRGELRTAEVKRNVAPVGGGDAQEGVEVPGVDAAPAGDHGGGRAHGPGPEAGPGAVGGGKIKRHADDCQIGPGEILGIGPAQEREGSGVGDLRCEPAQLGPAEGQVALAEGRRAIAARRSGERAVLLAGGAWCGPSAMRADALGQGGVCCPQSRRAQADGVPLGDSNPCCRRERGGVLGL